MDNEKFPKWADYWLQRWVIGAKAGNRECMSRVIERYLPILQWRANRFTKNRVEQQDIVQELCIRLMEYVHKYDPTSGLSFATYYTSYVFDYGLGTSYRRAVGLRTHKGAPIHNVVYDDVYAGDRGQQALRAEEVLVLKQKLERLLPKDREIARKMLLDGETAADIARQVGVSRQAVSFRVQKIEKELSDND